jgi:hypothetical protein
MAIATIAIGSIAVLRYCPIGYNIIINQSQSAHGHGTLYYLQVIS